jgi:acyl-CoA thioesterase YciA
MLTISHNSKGRLMPGVNVLGNIAADPDRAAPGTRSPLEAGRIGFALIPIFSPELSSKPAGSGLNLKANKENTMTAPTGELTLRTLAMPADANAAGDIFGGWVMAQMDLACGIRAAERARGRVVTAAVNEMSFAMPVKIGDTLCIYTDIVKVGRTSMTLLVEAWAQRYLSPQMDKVTNALFVMVALDAANKPTPLPAE